MKSVSAFTGSIFLSLLCAGCSADAGSGGGGQTSDPASSAAKKDTVGQSQEALTCGVYCTYAGTCHTDGKPGYFYKCVASACDYFYYTSCGAWKGQHYCALWGGC